MCVCVCVVCVCVFVIVYLWDTTSECGKARLMRIGGALILPFLGSFPFYSNAPHWVQHQCGQWAVRVGDGLSTTIRVVMKRVGNEVLQ